MTRKPKIGNFNMTELYQFLQSKKVASRNIRGFCGHDYVVMKTKNNSTFKGLKLILFASV